MIGRLAEGREAIERHEWDRAVRAFTDADEAADLSPDDLALFAEAWWWSGRPDGAMDTWERAYAGYVEAGEGLAAAGVALRLAEWAFRRMSYAIAGGWLAKAEALLADEPESGIHGWIEVMHTGEAMFGRGDMRAAIEFADRARELGRRHGDRDVESSALSLKGLALVKTGEWAEGIALVDQAATAALSGELSPKTACDIYCNTMAACWNLADYRRAGEWTEEADRWMERQSIKGFRGVCRVYRAELKRLRGSWTEAEEDARHACTELEQFRLMYESGFAHYEVGLVRLAKGDLDAADEAFTQAYEAGFDPQPGLGRLMLARGDVEDARASVERSLAVGETDAALDGSRNLVWRAQLLPALVEIALAAGDVDAASAATDELETIADKYDSVGLEAPAVTARGRLQLGTGEFEAAAAGLKRAWRLWQRMDLPYEGARTRVLLAQALLGSGDQTAARLELRAARSTLERLGANLELRRTDGLLDEDESAAPERVTKTFMFTDIVASTDLIGLIGDAAWDDLLTWHDRALRSAFAEHGGEVVRHTGDGFFVTFDRAVAAVECAVAIQRLLVDHRHQQGFAPWVRIGMHTTDAFRHREDYSGQGVHAAARIGALGDREEIVVSDAVIEEAGPLGHPVSDPRTVRLKGISEPMDVRTINWR